MGGCRVLALQTEAVEKFSGAPSVDLQPGHCPTMVCVFLEMDPLTPPPANESKRSWPRPTRTPRALTLH